MAHRQFELTLHRNHVSGLIVLALAAALTFGLSLFLASRSMPPTTVSIALASVSDENLSLAGITLLPPLPSGSAAAVPQSAAEQVAARVQPGVAIKEVVLARVVDRGGGVDTLAWVVSLDPAGYLPIPHAGVHLVPRFGLVVVDAKSGEFLFGSSVSDSTPISDAATP